MSFLSISDLDRIIALEQEIPQFLLCKEGEEGELRQKLDSIFNECMELRQYLRTEPETFFGKTDDSNIQDLEDKIQEKGFSFSKGKLRILSRYIVESDILGDWILKGGMSREDKWITLKNDSTNAFCVVTTQKIDGLLRVFFAEKIRSLGEDLGFVIPEKRFYDIPETDAEDPLYHKYLVVAKKLKVMDGDKSLDYLQNKLSIENQRKISERICEFIKRTGFSDAHFGNIRFLLDDSQQVILGDDGVPKLALIDTEPFGFLQDSASPDIQENLIPIHIHASIGMQNFRKKCCSIHKSSSSYDLTSSSISSTSSFEPTISPIQAIADEYLFQELQKTTPLAMNAI